MSVIGKKSSTLRKSNIQETKTLVSGVKNIRMWHQASEGDTSIPFGSLNQPSILVGITNPTSSEILSANLSYFSQNVEVMSSLNGILQPNITYVVNTNGVTFLNGYEAVENEIFTITYRNETISGNQIVDARPLISTGVLSATTDTYNVGEGFKYNMSPSQQQGDVLVFRDGLLQARCENNDIGNDGNYIEVSNGDGFSNQIQFKTVDALNDNGIMVVSNTLISERPNLSMMQYIDTLAGQLDAVVETLADVAGVPESIFQTAPNNVDLKAFGDQVIQNKNDIEDLQAPTEYTEKILSATVSVGGNIADLQFNNLEAGKSYTLNGIISFRKASAGSPTIQIEQNSDILGRLEISNSSGTSETVYMAVSIEFTASGNGSLTLTHNQSASSEVIGDGSKQRSFLTLREINTIKTSKYA